MISGARVARGYVARHLVDDLPARIKAYRDAWKIDGRLLPDPRKYLSYEPFAVDEYPSIYVTVQSGGIDQRLDYADANTPVYETIYDMRVYSWVLSDDPKTLQDSRDNLSSVIKESLISVPSLNRGGCYLKIEEVTMRESFSEMFPAKGDSVSAGAALDFNLRLLESLEFTVAGKVAEISLVAELFDVTPTAPSDLESVFRYAMDDRGGSFDEDAVVLGFVEPSYDGGFYDIETYEVSRRRVGSQDAELVLADSVVWDGRTLAVTGTPAGEFEFRIRAVNGSGGGMWSEFSPSVIVPR